MHLPLPLPLHRVGAGDNSCRRSGLRLTARVHRAHSDRARCASTEVGLASPSLTQSNVASPVPDSAAKSCPLPPPPLISFILPPLTRAGKTVLGWQGWSLLRPSSEHLLSVRAAGARRSPLPPHLLHN